MNELKFTNGKETKTAEELLATKNFANNKNYSIARIHTGEVVVFYNYAPAAYSKLQFSGLFPGWELVTEPVISIMEPAEPSKFTPEQLEKIDNHEKKMQEDKKFFKQLDKLAESNDVIPSNIVNFVDAEFDTLRSEFGAKNVELSGIQGSIARLKYDMNTTQILSENTYKKFTELERNFAGLLKCQEQLEADFASKFKWMQKMLDERYEKADEPEVPEIVEPEYTEIPIKDGYIVKDCPLSAETVAEADEDCKSCDYYGGGDHFHVKCSHPKPELEKADKKQNNA